MLTRSFAELKPLDSLRLRWAFYALLCLAFLTASYFFIVSWWQPVLATRWAFQAGLTLIYLLWVLWSGLEYNYRAGENQLLPTLGVGNVLTLLRGSLIAALIGFLFLPRPEGWQAWVPGFLYTTAALADGFDGYLARKTNHATRLGERLDISFDGIGVLAAALLAVQYGQVPAGYLLVAGARYLFLAGLWVRQRLGKPVYPLPASTSRRTFAGIQMGFLFVILWPVFSPPGTQLIATLFAVPFLTGFGRDWLVASGVIRTRKSTPERPPDTLLKKLTAWLLVGLRAVIFLTGLLTINQRFVGYPQQVTHLMGMGNPVPEISLITLGIIEVIAILMLTLGAGGRSAAILGLCLLGVSQMVAGLTPPQVSLAVLYTAILYLGTGKYSLWQPEERLIHNPAGEKPKP